MEIVQLLIDADENLDDNSIILCPPDTDNYDEEVLSNQNINGLSLLHIACTYSAPTIVIQTLLGTLPHLSQTLSNNGPGGSHLPIHAACRTGASPDTISALLKSYPEGAAVPDGNDGRLPLHLECMTRCHADIVRLLLDEYASGAGVVDVRGRTALHYAAETSKGANNKAVKLLMDAFPAALQMEDNEGCIPSIDLISKNEEDGKIEDRNEQDNTADDSRKRVVRFA